MNEQATKQDIAILLDQMQQIKGELKALRDSNLPVFVSPSFYAENTGLDISTVTRKCRLGELKSTKKGSRWLIHRSELDA